MRLTLLVVESSQFCNRLLVHSQAFVQAVVQELSVLPLQVLVMAVHES